jgi:DNA-nicking Smr family endonuclease
VDVSKKKQPSDEDVELFRAAVKRVTRLQHRGATLPRRRPPPVPRQTLADEERVLQDALSLEFDPEDVEFGDELHYARPGLQRGVMRKLRRGQFSVRAELDLHGLTVAEAHEALGDFLSACRIRDQQCVRIIHGKGHSSPAKRPVLKGRLNGWLRQRDEVLAFCSARPIDGGTGAVYVLLRRR